MLKKKAVLLVIGLVLALTAVACNAPAQVEVEAEIETETAVSARPARNRQTFSRTGQSDDSQDEGYDDADYDGDDEDYIDWFTIAADAMGMDEDALWEGLMAGSSIADLATANGADPNAIATTITVAETEWINDFAASGDITADEAAEWIAGLGDEVQEFMNDSSWALWEGVDWYTVAAEAIGIDEETLWEADSIAAAAEENGVEPQAVVEAIIAAEAGWLDGLVDADELTTEETVKWMAELNAEIHAFVEESWGYDGHGEFGDEFEGVDWYTVAAEAIGVNEETLWEAESIAAAAEANGVDAQTVIDAIAAAESEWLNGLVAADELTAEDVEEWTAEMDGEIREFVEESWEYDEFDGFEGVDWFTVAADTVNVDEDAFWEALMEGGSIADLAVAQNVDVQTLTDAIVAAESTSFAELVADGTITQEEADEWTAEIGEEVPEFLNDSSWSLWEGVDWYTIAQEVLGLEEDALWEALDNGQSLAELADEQGVDVQTIVDAVTAAETEWLNGMVASGELTQEEAAEWAAELDSEFDFFLNETWSNEY